MRFVLREQPYSCGNPTTGQFAKWADCARLVQQDEAAGGGTQQSGEHAPPTRARRQSVAPGHKITMPVDAKASVKEVLCREEVIISSSAVQAVLELACPDAAVCAHLVSWLQSVSSEESDDRAAVPPGMLHMDDVLEVAIAVWDEQEEKLAPQVEQMLQVRRHAPCHNPIG